jgi:hypothetical protein
MPIWLIVVLALLGVFGGKPWDGRLCGGGSTDKWQKIYSVILG